MRRHLPAGLLTCAIALAVLGACAHPAPTGPAAPTGPSASSTAAPLPVYTGPPPPGVPGFDYSDPDQVCRGFTVAMLSSDTTTDASPLDAYRRAAAFMTAPAPSSDPGLGDARWTEWVGHRARITVGLTDYMGELDPDEPGFTSRAVTATTTPEGADGWRGTTERETVYCTLAQTGSTWRVAGFDADYFGPV
jgi:hypothetical protein